MIKLFVLFIGLLIAPHPLHLSVTNLDFRSDLQSCQLTIKVFSDDFAALIRAREGEHVLPSRDSLQAVDSLFFKPLLRDRLVIRLDGKTVPISGWKIDSVRNNFEASWLYLSMDYSGDFREVSFQNSLFFDTFSDQKNLLFVSRDDQEKAFRLLPRKPGLTVRFD